MENNMQKKSKKKDVAARKIANKLHWRSKVYHDAMFEEIRRKKMLFL